MTRNERLRALLEQARERIGYCPCGDSACEPGSILVDRIDAALAEPVEVHTSSLTDVVTLLENDRDAARAEVERLRALLGGVVGACKHSCNRESHCGVCAIALKGISP